MSENPNDKKKDHNPLVMSSGGVNQESMDFNILEKNLKSELDSKLHYSVVGGYTKKSVENFVSEMKANLLQIKTQMEGHVQYLTVEKASAAQECSVLRNQLKTAEENLAEARNKIVNQQNYDETQYVSGHEMQSYHKEDEYLTSMQSDYQEAMEQNKKYEDLLIKKEQKITQLNETLAKSKQSYNELKERTEQTEKVTEKYQTFSQYMEKAKLHLKQKKQHLNEKEIQLEQEKKFIGETKTQLEQEKKFLVDEHGKLEREKKYLTEVKAQLKEDIRNNRTLVQELENHHQSVRQREEEANDLIAAKERMINILQREQEEYQFKNDELENKMEHQEKIISEKNQLLDKYQKQEKENNLIRKENERAIRSLQESMEQIMAHMDVQSEGIDHHTMNSRQESDALKDAVSESTQLRNTALKEQLVERNVELDEKPEQLKNVVLPFDATNRIVALGNSNNQHEAEDLEEVGLDTNRDAYQKHNVDNGNSLKDKTKVADIS